MKSVVPKLGVSNSTFARLNENRASSKFVGLKMWVQFATELYPFGCFGLAPGSYWIQAMVRP